MCIVKSLRYCKMEVAVVTDLDEDISPLYNLAKENVWQCFEINEGIGGRFCIFSDPGLITAAAIGMDIDAFLCGARDMENACQSASLGENPALLNAVLSVSRSFCRLFLPANTSNP